MEYTYGPKNFWQVKSMGNLKFDLALKPGDERYVDLNKARGEKVFNRLLKPLGFDHDFTPKSIERDENHYILFCGHRGCGKSTEIKRIAQKLHRPDGYFVVYCDIELDLDPNNIEYIDILFLVAQKIAETLDAAGISIDNRHIEDLRDFFRERIIKNLKQKDLEASINAGLKSKFGFEFISSIFASLTTAIKSNTTYIEEVRLQVKNQFSVFKTIFNRMLHEIKEN
ncbi:MAG: hypothetical protein MUF15_16930, partial [Acidobacteria bacterium]|nr:hypothetical protein [Acidobacteriota bacterium]